MYRILYPTNLAKAYPEILKQKNKQTKNKDKQQKKKIKKNNL